MTPAEPASKGAAPASPTSAAPPTPPRDRFRIITFIFVAVLATVHVPLLGWAVSFGLGVLPAIALFVLLQAIVIIRISQLRQPHAPPVWFERWVVWGYFFISAVALWFAPLLLGVWAFGLESPADSVAGGVAVVLGAVAAGIPWRFVVVRRVEVVVPGLAASLDGVTVAHLTDLHSGPMVPKRWLESWVRRTNALEPDFVVLTGDLIAHGSEFIPPLEAALQKLRPKRGTFAVMGNHDYFGGAGPDLIAMHGRLGVELLQNRFVLHDDAGAQLVVAGVDDTWRQLDDLELALAGAPADVPTLLLAHDPSLFAAAAARGVALQLSGHVHGGQLAIPFLGRRGSPLTWLGFGTVAGRYELQRTTLWLGAGLGTTGAPVRIGVPSEIGLIVLRAG